MNDEETKVIFQEILKWQKFYCREILRKKLKNENLLSSEREIDVYYHSDGVRSSRDIEKLVKVSYKTVQNLWKQWIKSGLAEPTKKYGGGRCKKIFNLNDLGLELTKIRNKGEESD